MGMLSLRKPSAESLRHFLASQGSEELTYSQWGATAETPPPSFVLDHTRIRLGTGEGLFKAAQGALRRWQQFDLGWVDAWPRDTTIEPGQVVAVMGRAVGLWWLNACRIVYVIDETDDSASRYGFANGTLPAHIQKGEERFLLEWNRNDDSVWFDILAFSRPNKWLTRIGYPLVRRSQKRFAREAAAKMFHAVKNDAPLPAVCQS